MSFLPLLYALGEKQNREGYGYQSEQYQHSLGGVITNDIKVMP